MIWRSLLIVATPCLTRKTSTGLTCILRGGKYHRCIVTHSRVCHNSLKGAIRQGKHQFGLTCILRVCMHDMNHSFAWHDTFACVTWLICVCDMTHSCVWHASSVCMTWCIHVCGMTHSCVWHDSFTCVPFRIRMYGRTHGSAQQGSFTSVIRLIRMCDMTHSYVWHDWFIYATWLIIFLTRMCDMPHSYVWHDSFVCVTWLILWVAWLLRMCDMIRFDQEKIDWFHLHFVMETSYVTWCYRICTHDGTVKLSLL